MSKQSGSKCLKHSHTLSSTTRMRLAGGPEAAAAANAPATSSCAATLPSLPSVSSLRAFSTVKSFRLLAVFAGSPWWCSRCAATSRHCFHRFPTKRGEQSICSCRMPLSHAFLPRLADTHDTHAHQIYYKTRTMNSLSELTTSLQARATSMRHNAKSWERFLA